LVEVQKLTEVDGTLSAQYLFLWVGRIGGHGYADVGGPEWRILMATIISSTVQPRAYIDPVRSSPTLNLPIDATELVNAEFSSGKLQVVVIERSPIDLTTKDVTEKKHYWFEYVDEEWKVSRVKTISKNVLEPPKHRMKKPD
jgi:hypothetical protein